MFHPLCTDITKRHDFILLVDVQDGNPNGDPDAGNLPRMDPETMQGLITDGCLKRKVRNFVDSARGTEERFKIYVQDRGIPLNALHERAYLATNIKSNGSKQTREEVEIVRSWMCNNFYDIRTFGAVMSTRINCGHVRGPVQLTFARSIDPVFPLDLAITRVAVTNAKAGSHTEKQAPTSGTIFGEMGRKPIVAYGLYRCFGFINPMLAAKTGFSDEDLELLWSSLLHTWDLDRSSARGLMCCRGLWVFTHDSGLGNAPADRLFSLLELNRRASVVAPRSFSDYELRLSHDSVPPGVRVDALASAWSTSSPGIQALSNASF